MKLSDVDPLGCQVSGLYHITPLADPRVCIVHEYVSFVVYEIPLSLHC